MFIRSLSVSRFVQDVRAVVAIQVVVFSVVLLTATGMVIDFGRAYAAHSKLQGIADKLALAAADQLDRSPTSIQDANLAITNLAAQIASAPSTGDVTFQIEEVFYLSGEPQFGAQLNVDALRALPIVTTNPLAATHVVVKARPATVRFSLLRLNMDGTNTDGVSDVTFSAGAVATRQDIICGPISTLVMCNPFENDPQTFADALQNGAGAHFLATVDLDTMGQPQLLAADNRIRLGLLKDPVNTVGADPYQVCSGAGLSIFQGAGWGGFETGTSEIPPEQISDDGWTYPTTSEELERLRDICLLAMVDNGLQCVGSQVLVKAAVPGDVVTGINTIFDLWDAPMDRVLNQAPSVDSPFQPDLASVHGMLNRAEFHTHMLAAIGPSFQAEKLAVEDAIAQTQIDLMNAEDPASQGLFEMFLADLMFTQMLLQFMEAEVNNVVAAYPDNLANPASRNNHVMMGAGMGWGPMYRGECLTDPENCRFAPYIEARVVSEVDVNDESLILVGAPQTGWTNGKLNLTSLGATQSGLASGWRLSNPTSQARIAELRFYGNASVGPWEFIVPANSRVNVRVPGQGTAIAQFDQGTKKTKATCPFTQCGFTNIPGEVVAQGLQAEEYLGPSFVEYFASYYTPYVNANALDLTAGVSELEQTIINAETYYAGYSSVERTTPEIWGEAASNGVSNETIGTNRFISTAPEHFQFASANPMTEQTTERRRQRVILINCQAMLDHATATGQNDPAFTDTYLAEIADIADVFLTEAPVVERCKAGTAGTDPLGINSCYNDDIESAQFYLEFISSLGQTSPADLQTRSYATLVY